MYPTHPFIDPVALSIGPIAVHWYGLMYLFGFGAFWLLGWIRSRQPNALINADQLTDLLFFGVAGVILGGRIGYVLFYQPGSLLQDPLLLVRLWEGGMSFHGGLLGVVLACVFFARSRQIPFLKLTDFVAPLIPLGLGFGRIGNWINGELWGRPTDLPWAMIFPMVDQLPRHPSQLYQASLEGLVLFILLWWFSARPRPIGAVSGVFLLAYGLFRFVVEFVREPDLHLGYLALGWLTMGQLLSLPMMLAGGLLLYTAYRRL
ncbi:Prolipoprotein diacylglyceryl transferase [Ectothiorhodosinus mongolicus]|uniref:Phosphatidylglycerol--prolipoprotein diacylglyceryl transferase n=1 Tax=Ectothiorhodosinus mongolicus TaxID=233100 RepID=A0A1R3W322_9GAMM|nr:prolipoprotein diacylglyceryl transferase [Ectothiorhodosinus mongolicus]ULX57993.1 prolipoprotein diacylglyceryl transferase [Ectothiorhodosinus mongolicus]SIT72169.1 Prolipoprotein diacylglyceryl transferase [Ectothiorhodosinus mongolicus]